MNRLIQFCNEQKKTELIQTKKLSFWQKIKAFFYKHLKIKR